MRTSYCNRRYTISIKSATHIGLAGSLCLAVTLLGTAIILFPDQSRKIPLVLLISVIPFAAYWVIRKRMVLQALFVLSFLPFLRLSAWGSGFQDLSTLDTVSSMKLTIRLLTISILFFYLLIRIKKVFVLLKNETLVLFLFLALAAVSVTYSSDSFYSFFRMTEHMSFFFFAITLVLAASTKTSIRDINNNLIVGMLLLIAVVWAVMIIMPEYAYRALGKDIRSLGGEIIHVHTLGIISNMVFAVCLHRSFATQTKIKKIALLTICLLLLVTIFLTHSRTSIVILTTVILLIFVYHRKFIAAIALVLIMGMLFVYEVLSKEIVLSYILRGSDVQNLVTLGFRTVLWQDIIAETIHNRLFLGYGYQMLGEKGISFSSTGYEVSMAHNTFVQTFAGLGLLGSVLLIFQIWLTLKGLIHLLQKSRGLVRHDVYELCLLFVVSLIASISEFGIAGMTTPVIPVYMCVVVLCTEQSILMKKSDRKSGHNG